MRRFLVPVTAKSWVKVEENHDFPIQNLPFVRGSRSLPSGDEMVPFCGIAIGDHFLDISLLIMRGIIRISDFPEELVDAGFQLEDGYPFDLPFLSREQLAEIREQAFECLVEDSEKLNRTLIQEALIAHEEVELIEPVELRAFVDFYSGIHHASNVGRMFRPDQPPLLPNYRWIPIGYNGRASSVVPSGFEITRPKGQMRTGEDPPTYGPTKELDFELEMGFFVGEQMMMGDTISVADAEELISGLVIVNDWSARDFQRWEYQPLGPFLAKSFATSISPYLVSLDALEPFRVEGMAQEPEPLDHLKRAPKSHYDIELEVWLQTEKMSKPQLVCYSNTQNLYWTMTQQLAHQCSNGTPVEPGDLYASGTISGVDEQSFGSMLELSWRGSKPLVMEETGEERAFLQDGDEVIMKAYAQGDGYRIGFGECSGRVVPAEE